MKGPAATRLEAAEKPDRDEDIALIGELERCELGYDWERGVLESASRRVFSEGRALMNHQRKSVEEIIERRRSGRK